MQRPKIRERPIWEQSDWEPPKRRRRPTASGHFETLREFELLLLDVFFEGVRRFGLGRTRQCFANYVREPSALDLQAYGEMKLLERLNDMKPRPNVKRLVRELLAENRDPSWSDRDRQLSADNLDKQIRRLKSRKDKVAAKFGNVSPPLRPDEPARFLIIETKNGTFRKRKMS
jgi:hypothetical protein